MSKKIGNAEFLMDAYATYQMETMDLSVLMQLAYDSVYDDLEQDYSDKHLLERIKDSGCSELLKEVEYVDL